MTKDNQSNKKTPGIINRTPLRSSKKLKAMQVARDMAEKGLSIDDPAIFDSQVEKMMDWDDEVLDGMWQPIAERTTWRKLDEQRSKSELEVAYEQAFVASADDREKQILDDKKAAKIVALIEQKERISNLKEKRMSKVAEAEAEAQGKDMDPIEDFSVPPAYQNPAVIEEGSFETWPCNKVSFSKRDPDLGLLAKNRECDHPNDVNGFCTTCGEDVMVSVGDPPTKADVIVKQVQDRIKANNGYGQEKYQHQINVKLTDEDMKRANAIKADIFSDDVSGSQLMRILIRQGMKKYEGNQ